jgi:hypothetical protein
VSLLETATKVALDFRKEHRKDSNEERIQRLIDCTVESLTVLLCFIVVVFLCGIPEILSAVLQACA